MYMYTLVTSALRRLTEKQVMTLIFTTIGSAADYGTFGRWLLLILTVICWAAQFASMSLTCAPCLFPCLNDHSHQDSS